jgi:hypothetical protein
LLIAITTFRSWGPWLLRSSLPVNRSSLLYNLRLLMFDHSPVHSLGLCSAIKYLSDCYLNIGIALDILFCFSVSAIKQARGSSDTSACWRSLLPRDVS